MNETRSYIRPSAWSRDPHNSVSGLTTAQRALRILGRLLGDLLPKTVEAVPNGATERERIAGRYEVEQQLAVGGMGEVLLVTDESTGRRLALKRVLDATDPKIVSMFEREYHALVSLKHPRIIQVFDYGIADGKPYYTMELLDGYDLRQHAPLPYQQACRYLRDVASSLALLHARRLLHRDVSPRNVRVTGDDRCKLIDFGAMAGFGVMEVVVGTPPYLPPEALQRTALDHRADLFALGALGYWLLTGKQAFPARALRELPELWRSLPVRPTEALQRSDSPLPAIPKGLDELIMSLLTIDPLGRPSSAVEVSDRLNLLADLEPERDVLSARSYLVGARIVGRQKEQARLRKRLDRCVRGKGGSVAIVAEPGLGSTRLIDDLALRAQLAGVTAVIVDAKVQHGVYGVAEAIVRELVTALPREIVSAAGENGAVLARFSPVLATRLRASQSLGPLPQGELRRRIQEALAAWLLALAAQKPLLLAIDNAQQLDEGSAALLATLARASREHGILLVFARKPSIEHKADPAAALALRAIQEASAEIELSGLSRDDVHELLQGVFGDVPNTGRLAEWLHSLGGDNPQVCMDLARHLIESQVIRFSDGAWVLPQELLPGELPANHDQALDARLDRLEPSSRLLAETLSVHRGALSLDRCLHVAKAEGLAHGRDALDALVREDVLVRSDEGYHFAHENVRERFYVRMPSARRAALHLRIGRALSAPTGTPLDSNTMLDAGWHLLQGGAESEGAELLATASTALTHSTDELAASVPALRAALAVFRREKRPKRELIRVLAPLAVAGYRVDRKLVAEYGDEAIDVFHEVIGLKLSARLRPLFGRKLSLYLGLAYGVMGALLAHGPKGIAVFKQTISTFFSCVVSLASASTICFDIQRTRRCVQALEPLAALGDDHPAGISYGFAKTLSRLPEDRVAEVAAGCEKLIARLGDDARPVKGLPEDSRLLLLGGAWYALGAMSVFRDGPYALHCAEKLDGLGLRLYAMAGDQVRTMYHALRGDIARAKQYRERVEMHAIQAGSGWQVEVWGPCGSILVCTLTRDVVGIKHVVEALDRLRKEVPTLNRHYELARGVYHELKGDLQVSKEVRLALLAGTAPRAFIGYPTGVGSLAATLLDLGEVAEAKAQLQVVIDHMTEADAVYIAMYQKAFICLALADAMSGDFEAATTRLDTLLAKHGPDEGPLTLGYLHSARARVAIMMDDLITAEHQRESMERWFRPTGNPALIGQCERMRREIARLSAQQSPVTDAEGNVVSPERTERTDVETLRSLLRDSADLQACIHAALELVVGRSHGIGGYLFLYNSEEDGLDSAVAAAHEAPPPAELARHVLASLHGARDTESEQTSALSATDLAQLSTAQRERVTLDDATYRVFVLSTIDDLDLRLVGGIAVRQGTEALTPPSSRLLDAVARALLDAREHASDILQPSIPSLTQR